MQPSAAWQPGLALVCTLDGNITEVLRNDLPAGLPLGDSLHLAGLLDQGSVQKALGLLWQAREEGAAFGCELDLAAGGTTQTLRFDAARLGTNILLMGCTPAPGDPAVLNGMSRVINEQINSLRALHKSRASTAQPGADAAVTAAFSREMFSDMMALNNRLVDAERELARRNAELRRLSAVLQKDLHLAHRVLQSAGEAVVITDAQRRVVDTNPAYSAITGWRRDEQLGSVLELGDATAGASAPAVDIWSQVTHSGHWQGECTGLRKNGERFPQWLTINTVPGDNGAPQHYVVSFSDISRLKQAEENWHRLAFHDSLTHLPNRVLFKDRLQQAIERARRDGNTLALLFIDLDEFKLVNDSLGHDAGDELLVVAARRIQGCVRHSDTLARLGGDEFTVILYGSSDDQEVTAICDKIILALNAPFEIGDQTVRVGASVGVACFPEDGDDTETLLKRADTAMYAAKAAGRNTSRRFAAALGEDIAQMLKVKTQIVRGLQRGEFRVVLQPVVDLASGQVRSLEALLRWDHPDRGCLGPDQFIPVAEESGLILELGQFVIRQACALASDLRRNGWPQAQLAVNVSRRQLAAPGLLEFVADELARCDLPGDALIVEVTESLVMGNLEQAAAVLAQLRALGVRAAIDDFGTGYSSLNALRRLPVSYLKIDKSFVADADISRDSAGIMGAIVAMAHGLGLKTVAEGVEREAQRDLLRQVGCDTAQGYWFARPQPLEALRSMLQPHDPRPG